MALDAIIRISEAEELANETMAAIPDHMSHYEPLCDMFLIPDGEKKRVYLRNTGE